MANRKRKRGLRGADADELGLWIDNTYELYRRKEATRTNLVKHVCRGRFDKTAAARGFSHVTNEGARHYAKEIGEKIPTSARRELDKEYVNDFLRDVNACLDDGMCNDLTNEQRKLLEGAKCKPGGELRGPRPRHAKRRRKRRR